MFSSWIQWRKLTYSYSKRADQGNGIEVVDHLRPGAFHQAVFNGKVPHDTRNATDLEREVYRWHTCIAAGISVSASAPMGRWKLASSSSLMVCIMAMVRLRSSVGLQDDHSGEVVV
jgi:hypothetical protein